MPEIDVNTMIWEMFMSATMEAAVHLGQDHQDNLHTTKNAGLREDHTIDRYFTEN